MPILERETSVFPACLLEDPEFEPGRSDRHWWAIFTRSRQEKALARDLERYTVPFYLPLVIRQNHIRNRRVESFVPLFAGYVFLFASDEERVRALTTNRVASLVRVPDQRQLHDDLVQLQRLIETGAPLTLERRLEPGRRVEICRGALQGLEGIVTHRRGGKRRLLVVVDFLQRGVSIEIDDFMVEKV